MKREFLLGYAGYAHLLFRLENLVLVMAVAVIALVVGLALSLAAIGAVDDAVVTGTVAAYLVFAALASHRQVLAESRARPVGVLGYRLFGVGLALCLGALLFGRQFEYTSLFGDIGVYVNEAWHLRSGGTIPFQWNIQALDIGRNDAPLPAPLGMINPAAEGLWQFHALPVWPALMAVSRLPGDGLPLLAVLFSLNLILFYFVMEGLFHDARIAAATTTVLASLPLMWHQALYATAEMLLLAIVLSTAVMLLRLKDQPFLIGSGVFAFGVTHMGIVVLAPAIGMVLTLAAITAGKMARMGLARLGVACAAAAVASFELSGDLSAKYASDIVASMFGKKTYLAHVACLVPLLAVLPYVLRDVVNSRMYRVRAAVLYFDRNFAAVATATVVVAALCLLVQSYLIGWTDFYRPAEHSTLNSWSARVAYVNRGFFSLQHLSILNMVYATAGLGFLAFILAPRHLARSRPQRLLWVFALYFVFIYGLYRVDIPNNYYGSRYFLPVLVPALMAIAGFWLLRQRSAVYYYLILPVLALAFYFNGASIGAGFFSGDKAVRAFLAEQIGPGYRVLFLGGDWLKYHLYPVLLNRHVTRQGSGQPAADEAIVITEVTEDASILVGGQAQCMAYRDRQIPWTIAYPTGPEVVDRKICVHRAGKVPISTHDFANNHWLLDGVEDFYLFVDPTKREVTVEIRSYGWWSSKPPFAADFSSLAPRLTVCGQEFERVSLAADRFVFKGRPARAVCQARITTNTFVPSEQGLGSDTRKLGADIHSISVR